MQLLIFTLTTPLVTTPDRALAKVEDANATHKHVPATRCLSECAAFYSADTVSRSLRSDPEFNDTLVPSPGSPAGDDLSFTFPVSTNQFISDNQPAGLYRRSVLPPFADTPSLCQKKRNFSESCAKKLKKTDLRAVEPPEKVGNRHCRPLR